ncbi:hypothetical protein IWW38_004389, partial [Coemansia aciculifera]
LIEKEPKTLAATAPVHTDSPPISPPSSSTALYPAMTEAESMARLSQSSFQLSVAMLIAYVLAKTDDSFPEELGANVNETADKALELERRLTL